MNQGVVAHLEFVAICQQRRVVLSTAVKLKNTGQFGKQCDHIQMLKSTNNIFTFNCVINSQTKIGRS